MQDTKLHILLLLRLIQHACLGWANALSKEMGQEAGGHGRGGVAGGSLAAHLH